MDYRSFLASIEEISSLLNKERLCDVKKLQECVSHFASTVEFDCLANTFSSSEVSIKDGSTEKIHTITVGLWNGTVAKYCGKIIPTQLNCTLRQLCFDLACLAESTGTMNVGKNETRRTITMGIKVGKAWLEAAEHGNAMSALEKTKAKIEELARIEGSGNLGWTGADKLDVEKDWFIVMCTMAEVMISRGSIKEAAARLEEASKASFISNPDQSHDGCLHVEKLCSLTFNCGLSLANEMKYNDAIDWLQKSYEAGKSGNYVKTSILGRILRLTAHCYAELQTTEGNQNAMNALELAESYVSHPAGLLLKLKILAKNNAISNDVIDPMLKKFLAHPDITIDLALACCRHLNDNGRLVLCERALESLLNKYSNSSQISRVYAKRFEYNMERLENADAVEYTQEFLRGTNIIQAMDQKSKICIQLILWKRAESCEENGDDTAILQWYDFSMKFYQLCGETTGNNDDINANMAKLLRNRSACFLSLGRTDEASKSAADASRLQPDNPRSDFALFNVAMHQGNDEEAMRRIDRVADKCSDGMEVDGGESDKKNMPIHSLVCLCAQTAFEKEKFPVAQKALQSVQKTTTNRTAKVVALKCLVRLILKNAQDSQEKSGMADIEGTLKDACSTVQEALEVLEDVLSRPLDDAEVESWRETALSSQTDKFECTNEFIQDEADWFMKISWNMAIEAKAYSHLMKELFQCCYKFLGLLQEDDAILTRQKTCILMACAASLELARTSTINDDVESNSRFALDQISLHKSICSRLASVHGPSAIREKEIVLRSMYEFEANLKLSLTEKPSFAAVPTSSHPQELHEFVNTMLLMPQVTVNTLETMAALCIEPPTNQVQLCKGILREGIARLSRQINSAGDNEMTIQLSRRISMFYRMLIELTLRQGTGVDCVSKDEALNLLREALHLVEDKLKDSCPEQELLWFMVNGWNVGARLYVAEYVNKAEKWLSTSMRFLVHLKDYKAGYEDHMNETYMKVLTKKDSIARSAKQMEIV